MVSDFLTMRPSPRKENPDRATGKPFPRFYFLASPDLATAKPLRLKGPEEGRKSASLLEKLPGSSSLRPPKFCSISSPDRYICLSIERLAFLAESALTCGHHS